MSPKKLEIDNRDKKTPPVHRFMTQKAPSAPTEDEIISSSEENIASVEESKSGDKVQTAEVITAKPAKDTPPPAQPAVPTNEEYGGLVITEVAAPLSVSADDNNTSVDSAKYVNIPDNTSTQTMKHVNADNKNAEIVSSPKEPEIDYKALITTVQDKIDDITNSQSRAQEDLKTQIKSSLKLELIEEIKNELKNEIREELAEQEQAERERLEKEKTERERVERERLEKEKAERERAEQERLEKEKAEEKRYIFRNTMEEIVMEEVTGFLKNQKNMCKCSHCVNDICAIALNLIPPHYVTSEVGHLFNRASLLDITKLNNVTSKILQAIEQVKNNPLHSV